MDTVDPIAGKVRIPKRFDDFLLLSGNAISSRRVLEFYASLQSGPQTDPGTETDSSRVRMIHIRETDIDEQSPASSVGNRMSSETTIHPVLEGTSLPNATNTMIPTRNDAQAPSSTTPATLEPNKPNNEGAIPQNVHMHASSSVTATRIEGLMELILSTPTLRLRRHEFHAVAPRRVSAGVDVHKPEECVRAEHADTDVLSSSQAQTFDENTTTLQQASHCLEAFLRSTYPTTKRNSIGGSISENVPLSPVRNRVLLGQLKNKTLQYTLGKTLIPLCQQSQCLLGFAKPNIPLSKKKNHYLMVIPGSAWFPSEETLQETPESHKTQQHDPEESFRFLKTVLAECVRAEVDQLSLAYLESETRPHSPFQDRLESDRNPSRSVPCCFASNYGSLSGPQRRLLNRIGSVYPITGVLDGITSDQSSEAQCTRFEKNLVQGVLKIVSSAKVDILLLPLNTVHRHIASLNEHTHVSTTRRKKTVPLTRTESISELPLPTISTMVMKFIEATRPHVLLVP